MTTTPPCPNCGARLTLYPAYAKCYACGWTAEPNPYRGRAAALRSGGVPGDGDG